MDNSSTDADVDAKRTVNRLYCYLNHLPDCALRRREPDCNCGLDQGITDQANGIKTLESELAALRARAERTEAALRTYGIHRTGCEIWITSALGARDDCSCGLTAALAAPTEPEP